MIDFLLAESVDPLVLAPSPEVTLPAIPKRGDYILNGSWRFEVSAVGYVNNDPTIYVVVIPIGARPSSFPST